CDVQLSLIYGDDVHTLHLVQDVVLDYCQSEEYNICPFYKIIIENQPYCENIEECGHHLHRLNSVVHHNTDIYKRIMHLVFNYCLSENKIECARLKLIKKGEIPPNDLLQDGSRLKPQDILTNYPY
ncbi:hypothetical protein ACFL1L_04090, partial [Thermoplasmatota archaeon]